MPLVEPNAKFGEEWTRIQERQLGQPASKRIYTFLHVTWRLVVRAERRVTVGVGYMESWRREMVAAFITGDKYRYLEVDDVNDLIEEKFQTMWDSLRDNEDTHSLFHEVIRSGRPRMVLRSEYTAAGMLEEIHTKHSDLRYSLQKRSDESHCFSPVARAGAGWI